MYANYHTHTKRCRHASGEDREYVETAIEAGIKILGFSDHGPWIYPNDFVSRIRMQPEELEEYVDSLTGLRDEYADDIKILIGLEMEYVPELMEAEHRFLSQYPIDYMILGQHFVGEEETSQYMGVPTSDLQLLQQYVDSVVSGMKSGMFQYLAHPDLINFIGNQKLYRRAMRRLLEFMKEQGYPIELNMLGAVQSRNYPNETFWELAREIGNQVIIGIDAHSPEQLNDPEGELLCMELAQGMEIVYDLPGGEEWKK